MFARCFLHTNQLCIILNKFAFDQKAQTFTFPPANQMAGKIFKSVGECEKTPSGALLWFNFRTVNIWCPLISHPLSAFMRNLFQRAAKFHRQHFGKQKNFSSSSKIIVVWRFSQQLCLQSWFLHETRRQKAKNFPSALLWKAEKRTNWINYVI